MVTLAAWQTDHLPSTDVVTARRNGALACEEVGHSLVIHANTIIATQLSICEH
jgi:hypothetical protein